MLAVQHFLIICAILIEVYGQFFVGDVCTLKSSGDVGICTLFNQCKSAQDNLKKDKSSFPQICGFEGTQSIVCCVENQKPKRKPGEISTRKCREYGAYVYEKNKNPTLLPNASDFIRYECDHKVVKLIVGGEIAGRKEFPHMAAIGFEPLPGEIEWGCGGTILSKHYILTAAHCLYDNNLKDAKWVKLGVTALNDISRHRQQIKVAERIAHPEYKSSSHYHDIGLIRLQRSAKLNSFTRPACLYLKSEPSTEKAIATGWGRTEWAAEVGSNNLLKVTIDLYDHEFCNASYKKQIGRRLMRGIVDDIQLCAGSEDKKDTCQGDSGGPLQIYHYGDDVKCMYDIIGITSFGEACNGAPGVYVRVSHYIKWIEDTVWPQK